MGNRSSAVQQSPAPPPALLTAAVVGDLTKFQTEWNAASTSAGSLTVKDHQENNVLHALFSCRAPDGKAAEILDLIHSSSGGDGDDKQKLTELYHAKNSLGCTPLWILVAYGNVDLLKHVQTKLQDNESTDISQLLIVPNHQGDSPLLATCSQGNADMVRYLKENVFTPTSNDKNNNNTATTEDPFTAAISQANSKGTTPLQIVIGNAHTDLLKFLLAEDCVTTEWLLEKSTHTNAAGLSLFHICSERNFDAGLRLLLEHIIMVGGGGSTSSTAPLERVLDLKDKNKANALHVAAFCGNEQVVQVWVDMIQQAAISDTTTTASSTGGLGKLLDAMDGQARTAYWLAMVQGHDQIGVVLATAGVDTKHPNMVKEIEEAKQKRLATANKRKQQQQQQQLADGAH